MGTEDQDNDTKVKVAKITATQTIIVALITTIGGGLIGFFISGNKIPLHAVSNQIEHTRSCFYKENFANNFYQITQTINREDNNDYEYRTFDNISEFRSLEYRFDVCYKRYFNIVREFYIAIF